MAQLKIQECAKFRVQHATFSMGPYGDGELLFFDLNIGQNVNAWLPVNDNQLIIILPGINLTPLYQLQVTNHIWIIWN